MSNLDVDVICICIKIIIVFFNLFRLVLLFLQYEVMFRFKCRLKILNLWLYYMFQLYRLYRVQSRKNYYWRQQIHLLPTVIYVVPTFETKGSSISGQTNTIIGGLTLLHISSISNPNFGLRDGVAKHFHDKKDNKLLVVIIIIRNKQTCNK